jgi:hypothetical protein
MRNPPRILVIDDDPTIGRLLSRVGAGVRVDSTMARTGVVVEWLAAYRALRLGI